MTHTMHCNLPRMHQACATVYSWASWSHKRWQQLPIDQSQILQCTCSRSHNAPVSSEMCTFLLWMVHCRIMNSALWDLWIRSIAGPVWLPYTHQPRTVKQSNMSWCIWVISGMIVLHRSNTWQAHEWETIDIQGCFYSHTLKTLRAVMLGCHHWGHWRLSLWQPLLLVVMTKLASWKLSDFSVIQMRFGHG